MPEYTVRDKRSGKTVTFNWKKDTPPVDADFERVFSAAGLRTQDGLTQNPATQHPPAVQQPSPMQSMGQNAMDAFSAGPNQVYRGLGKIGNAATGDMGIGQRIEQGLGGGLDVGLGAIGTLFSPVSAAMAAGNTPLRPGGPALLDMNPMAQQAGNVLEALPTVANSLASNVVMPGINAGAKLLDKTGAIPQIPITPETRQGMEGAVGLGLMVGAPKLSEFFTKKRLEAPAKKTSEIQNTAVAEMKLAAPAKRGELRYDETAKRISPYIAAEERVNPLAGEGMRGAVERMNNIRGNIWGKVLDQVKRHSDARIDYNKTSKAARSVIDENLRQHDPAFAAKIEAYADTFEGNVPIQRAHDYVSTINAKYGNFYNKTVEQQAALLQNDPLIEAKLKVADNLRNQIFDKMDQYGETSTRELRRDYGAATFMKQAFERNIVKAEKQQKNTTLGRFASPTGVALATEGLGIGMIHHPKTTLASMALGVLRDSFIQRGKANPTINRAFKKLGKTTLSPRVYSEPDFSPKGLLPPATIRLGPSKE